MLSSSSARVGWGLAIGFFVAALIQGVAVRAAELAGSRPNIILVITDDQGYGDLACHGNPVIKTPHLDKLHSESARFTDFHVSPTCAPTRSAIMTGRHEFYNGVTHTILERERLRLDAITMPTVLKQAGYTTGIFGKWHLGDEPEYWPSKRGFDEMFIHGCGGIGQSYPGTCGDCPGNKYFNPVINHNGKLEATNGYCTDVFFKQALSWIDSKRSAKQPFYVQIATNAPHAPHVIADKYAEPYQGKVPPEVAKFYGMIANIDENVGALREKLKEWKLDENTLLIFMTDNGTATGEKVFNAGMRGKKVTPFLGGTRVPSFWYWAGKTTPGDIAATTAHLDIFPTLAELAGAQLPAAAQQQIQGRSLVPLLNDSKATWSDRYLVAHTGRWQAGLDVANAPPNEAKYAGCSIRWRNYQAASPAVKAKAGSGWELYDLTADPGETKDIAAEHPEIVKQLDAEYGRWWTAAVPNMVNETAAAIAAKLKFTPYKELYWNQFRGPGPNNAPPPEGFEFAK
jgi:arylsulfatase A-like enzyme